MDDKTREALEASIEHWTKNASAKAPAQASIRDRDCALCVLFNGAYYKECIGCPVLEKTGRTLCYNTPYRKAAEAYLKWDTWPVDEERGKAFRALARAELDFLKSLRPEEN